MMRRALLSLLALLILAAAAAARQPKREFRGAWIQTVFRDDYARRSPDENRRWLSGRLDALEAAGINAVIFQVRPSADAFYDSSLEPSSRFLAGQCGASAGWDPLQFMIEECHRRGMELHAWLNPYRVTTSKGEKLPPDHIAAKHPERTVTFNGRLYFNPAIKENRDWIVDVVRDIAARYDIDAIHFDDYFYPYPVKGVTFNDEAQFRASGGSMKLADWRRRNVDLLIQEVSAAVKEVKPWVRFGISPFGIWRNSSSDPRGSATRGLQNYDDLYADVLLWAEKGWIDYLMPQLYWATDHKLAGWDTLASWWGENVAPTCQVIIGQDVKVTMDAGELHRKMTATRSHPRLDGSCWWPAALVADNHGGIADTLGGTYHAAHALPPAYPGLSSATPSPVFRPRAAADGTLSWTMAPARNRADDAVSCVIYLFPAGRPIDLADPEGIYAITRADSIRLPEGFRGIAALTTLSRANIESRPVIIHIQ